MLGRQTTECIKMNKILFDKKFKSERMNTKLINKYNTINIFEQFKNLKPSANINSY